MKWLAGLLLAWMVVMGCAQTQLDEADEAKRVYDFSPTQIANIYIWFGYPVDFEEVVKACKSGVTQTMGAFNINVITDKKSDRASDQDATQTTDAAVEGHLHGGL